MGLAGSVALLLALPARAAADHPGVAVRTGSTWLDTGIWVAIVALLIVAAVAIAKAFRRPPSAS